MFEHDAKTRENKSNIPDFWVRIDKLLNSIFFRVRIDKQTNSKTSPYRYTLYSMLQICIDFLYALYEYTIYAR